MSAATGIEAEVCADIAHPRMLAMFIAFQKTDLPPSDIGELFNRDRTTVYYAVKKVNQLLEHSEKAAEKTKAVIEVILKRSESKKHHEFDAKTETKTKQRARCPFAALTY